MSGAVKKILVVLDHNGNEIRNFLVHVLAADPASPTIGQMWFNSTEGNLKYRNASGIQSIASGGETHDHSNKSILDQLAQADLDKLDGITAGATKTEDSATNGKIKINGAESVVYTHPASHSLDVITETSSKKIMTSTERAKLAGIAANANNYSHPLSHPATIITQDSTHRFVSDSEKTAWNAKYDSSDRDAANGICGLDANALVPSENIPAIFKSCSVVANIGSRDALDPFSGMHCFVVDASDDTTVTSGSAEYVWNDTAWVKLYEQEGLDPILTVATLTDTTISSVTSGELLKWNGSKWINQTLSEAGIEPKGTASSLVGTHAADTTSVHGITNTSDLALKSGNVNQFSDITSAGSSIEDAVSKRHTRSHSIGSASDHSAGTLEQLNALVSDATLVATTGVTYERLDANGDVGTGSTQLAPGNHSHWLSNLSGVNLESSEEWDFLVYRPLVGGWIGMQPSELGMPSHFLRTYALTLSTSATSYTVTHSLGTKDVIVQIYDNTTGEQVEVGIERYSTSQIKLYFATAPEANAYRVVVMG